MSMHVMIHVVTHVDLHATATCRNVCPCLHDRDNPFPWHLDTAYLVLANFSHNRSISKFITDSKTFQHFAQVEEAFKAWLSLNGIMSLPFNHFKLAEEVFLG